jgi:uncharacterized cupredoxin-like copper-binding protein
MAQRRLIQNKGGCPSTPRMTLGRALMASPVVLLRRRIPMILARTLTAVLGIAALVGLAAALPAVAATTVAVSLWDKGANVEMPLGLGYLMGGDMSKATMGITATPDAAKAGVVTFKVINDAKDTTLHEMIVMLLADPTNPLPYLDSENRVDEDRAGDKGEVSELEQGAAGSLTVNLKPGKYLLICNVPGHFGAGMWTTFTVNP